MRHVAAAQPLQAHAEPLALGAVLQLPEQDDLAAPGGQLGKDMRRPRLVRRAAQQGGVGGLHEGHVVQLQQRLQGQRPPRLQRVAQP
ncbi:MAG: hypothetical protein WDN49_25085 [Acetobacteraceae bacterium]